MENQPTPSMPVNRPDVRVLANRRPDGAPAGTLYTIEVSNGPTTGQRSFFLTEAEILALFSELNDLAENAASMTRGEEALEMARAQSKVRELNVYEYLRRRAAIHSVADTSAVDAIDAVFAALKESA